jgi:hypothetical protein
MYKFKSLAVGGALAAVSSLLAAPAAASVSLDFQVAFNPTNDTHVILRATTDHYRPVPADLQGAAVICHRPEEMAVVFFLSQEGRVPVREVVARRTEGRTWGELFLAYHVSTERLYLDVPAQVGPPYGKAKGHAKRKGKDRAKRLSDADIIELVGLQLAASYYHVDPMQIIDSRRNGISYVSIHGGLYREQHPVRMQRVKAPPEEGDDAIVIGRAGQGKLKGKGKSDGSN